jgi:hypothetical protein
MADEVFDGTDVVRQLFREGESVTGWTCSHDTGHIWEAILPHPSESMSLILQALERQRSAVSLGINWLYWLILKALNDLTR